MPPEPMDQELTIRMGDLIDPRDASDALAMIEAYARNPFGQGRDLDPGVREVLIERLKKAPGVLIFLARTSEEPVGIAVCFQGFSTFAARPLINIHDIYVEPVVRGQGVGQKLLQAVEDHARSINSCRLTLEVQERNSRARDVYERFGFVEGAYGAKAGRVLFRWKDL